MSQIENQDKILDSKQMIHLSLPMGLLIRLDKFVTSNKFGRYNSRVSAIIDLLNVGLWFTERKEQFEAIFKNPELMEELASQLHEGGLVDYVQRMNWQEFQVVWSIFKTEAKDRKML